MGYTGSENFRTEYHKYTFRKIAFILMLMAVIVLLSGYSCMISGRDMTLVEGLRAIWNHILGVEFEYNSPQWWDDKIIWSVTMPRVALGIIAGCGLAISGAIMQGVLSNPLAEPYTMGVSSGVVFGANLAIVAGLSLASSVHTFGIVLNAFIMGLVPVATVIVLMRIMRSLSPVTIILSGVAISYFFGGLNTLLLVGAEEESLSQAYQWQVGSLENTLWSEVEFVFVVVLVLVFISLFLSKYLNALTQGDNLAKSLGMDVDSFRLYCMILVTLMSASILCFTGIIGFVGLLAPHIVRLIIGGDNRYVLPASCVFGSAFLLFADTVTRMVAGIDVPVGAVMAFFGAPLFLFIILRSNRRRCLY